MNRLIYVICRKRVMLRLLALFIYQITALMKQRLSKQGLSKQRLLWAVCTTLLLGACSTNEPNSAQFVSGKTAYQGRQVELVTGESVAVDQFLGIPFAKPPINERRWAAPQALERAGAERTVNATKFAPACMQGPHIANWYKGVIESFGGDAASFPTPEVSEDCLYLNIWRPSEPTSSALPVFVFIHGGSNKGGWSYEPNYIGQQLASRGAVVVTLAYRLGVFGFFSHPELSQVNFALQDQIAALKWIKQNIAAAGGDPNNVTVAGESAGASNIAYLMAAPPANGLFHRAIHQSGGWAMYRTQDKTSADSLGLNFAKLATGREAASIAELRALDSEHILSAADIGYQGHFFDPVIDNATVPRSLAKSAELGELAKVDLMIGTNANESRMYLADGITVDAWLTNNLAEQEQGVSHAKIKAELNAATQEPLAQVDLLATSFNYTCPSFVLARANAKRGGKTWFYQFTKQRDGELGAQMGAYHGAELPYVFDTHDSWLPTTEQDRVITQTIAQYWLNFARTGNPNDSTYSVSVPPWQAYQKAGDSVQFLGLEVKSATHPSDTLCRLMEKTN